ncbi:MAG: NUDIX hydrolase [Patescibacteria group bacterium]
MIEEYKNFVNLGIVRNKNGEVLIIKRKVIEKGSDGARLTWAFPGGKQKNENREECVEREILSETGYKVKVSRQISLRVHPQFTKILCYFLCELINENKIQEPEEPDEIEEAKWVKPEDLKNYFTTNLDPNVAKELKI